LHALDSNLRNVPERLGVNCYAVRELDVTLGLDLDRACDGLGPITLFGCARDPFAIDLEARQPDLAVALQVDVQADLAPE